MPIYEYQCTACNHRFETLQKMSEPTLTVCPQCGQSTLSKLVSAAAFRLKGQGWYETDFKKNNQKGLASDQTGGDQQSADTPASDSNNSKTEGSTVNKDADKTSTTVSEKAPNSEKKTNNASNPAQTSGSSASSSGNTQ